MKALALAAALLLASPLAAAEISTHVLDLASGVGGKDVPVTLARRQADGGWTEIAAARTDANGRIRSFGDAARFAPGLYRLQFDLSAYPDDKTARFFPEITLTFRVDDAAGHYHVPVVVSPFGYSTYRGN
ncbi:hydroxyisourate hydrolase [Polymorphobacter fuscus]|uniref:5-hydroxyisourate hydrolase n=1 Tax=Sandarakinorhabdus fusca TaxID=1439888 RepID=A0A7C9KG53_9SPHN|nr:hydroxyisourate hydrolase [Polymorphobacter fuscus]KAB7648308.1 hydroxyisourate hydrolase [Polymorphobacter fuscus]MQT15820.1 hydroxyisourate hydrolase [Polymorphobacter fuscus]NJC07906.1 5-hydroxyisourate hydrolase [Polymorphobacter fuscus]